MRLIAVIWFLVLSLLFFRPGVDDARDWLRERTIPRQFTCAHWLWMAESSWYPKAGTLTGAYGIPQAYPGRKMEKAEKPRWGRKWDDWRYDPHVQVRWGRAYVGKRYGTFCEARAFQVEHGWY